MMTTMTTQLTKKIVSTALELASRGAKGYASLSYVLTTVNERMTKATWLMMTTKMMLITVHHDYHSCHRLDTTMQTCMTETKPVSLSLAFDSELAMITMVCEGLIAMMTMRMEKACMGTKMRMGC